MHHGADSSGSVFPSTPSVCEVTKHCSLSQITYQDEVVNRGILSSSGILLSSIPIFDRNPGFSCHSTDAALRDVRKNPAQQLQQTHLRVSKLMSPPKYRERSPGDLSQIWTMLRGISLLTDVGSLLNDGSLEDGFVPPVL